MTDEQLNGFVVEAMLYWDEPDSRAPRIVEQWKRNFLLLDAGLFQDALELARVAYETRMPSPAKLGALIRKVQADRITQAEQEQKHRRVAAQAPLPADEAEKLSRALADAALRRRLEASRIQQSGPSRTGESVRWHNRWAVVLEEWSQWLSSQASDPNAKRPPFSFSRLLRETERA